MSSYYSTHLSAQRLKRVYDIAPPRVQQYLHAEIEHVASHIKPGDSVLELGCGYGRVLKELAERSQATEIIGIDTSIDSLVYGIKDLRLPVSCQLVCMDAAQLGFCDGIFDV